MPVFVKGHRRKNGYVAPYQRAKRFTAVERKVASRMARGATPKRFAQLSKLRSTLEFEAKNARMLHNAVNGKRKPQKAYYQYRANFGHF